MGMLSNAANKLSRAVEFGAEAIAQTVENRRTRNEHTTEDLREIDDKYGTKNYDPEPIMVSEAEDVVLTDKDGRKYIDCLAAYSAVNQGHVNPRITVATILQMLKVALTSRAFENDQLPLLYKELADQLGTEMALPMNSGAEAVETALKAVLLEDFVKQHAEVLGEDKTKWAKIIEEEDLQPREGRKILAANHNFHGRTARVLGASSEAAYRNPFGPYDGLFENVDYGDIDAVRTQIEQGDVIAIMVEPIQAEGGIIVPPDGYLQKLRELCDEHDVRLIFDEIQTGLGRTGKMMAAEHSGVEADIACIGKALSGGNYPVSAIVGKEEILSLFSPGSHGSTYGGNPVAAATAIAALRELVDKKLPENAEELGEYFMSRLREIDSPIVKEIRGKGLLIGIALTDGENPADYCQLLGKSNANYRGENFGIACHDAHGVIRIAPPLTITKDHLDAMLPQFARVLGDPNWERFINPEVEKPLSVLDIAKNTAGDVKRSLGRLASVFK